MNVQPNDDELSTVNGDYLRRVSHSHPENTQEYFNNCLLFRVLLYILRKRLLSFIERKFDTFIRQLGLLNRRRWHLKRCIEEEIRTDFRHLGLNREQINSRTRQAKRRKRLVKNLKTNQLQANWRTFANCYTGGFILLSANQREQFNIEGQFDPKDLLEVLMNCSLFPYQFCEAAYSVIRNRNVYYGHIPELLIDTDTIKTLRSSTSLLADLIST